VLLVNLDVGSKFEATVLRIVEVESGNDAAGTQRGGNPVRGRKHVEPKDTGVDHFDGEAVGHLLKGERVVCAPGALLDGADVALRFGNVFITGHDVEGDAEGSSIATEGLKLSVKHDVGELESTSEVCRPDLFQSGEQGGR